MAPVAALAGLAALVRLPFLGSIGPDEGGYAYVAWQWAQGHALYRSIWVDRPQGLILVYRLLDSIAHAAWAIRLGALVSGVVITVLLVLIGRLLESPAAGLLAGGLYAIAGIGPHVEGYTFNGELAAAVPSTAAVAAVLLAYRRRSRPWLVAAGALGGAAVLMKQSGFDGLAVVIAVALFRPGGRRRGVTLALAGTAVPLGASAIAGWVSGWHPYWSALVGYHLGATTAASRLTHLIGSLPQVANDLVPLALPALAGLWLSRRQPLRLRVGIVWLSAALVGVNVGGLYWAHYYVQLLAPLCLLAGFAVARIRTPALAWATAAVVALPALAFLGALAHASDYGRDRMVKYTLGFENDERIARYAREHSSPRQSVYALVSRADFYFLAGRTSASPYLWAHPLDAIPGARAALARTLAASRRPRFVVLFQQAPLHGDERLLRPILARYYRPVWRAPGTGTTILAARTATTAARRPARSAAVG